MIKLDDNLLAELGLASLPKEEKDAFLKHMYETLEMRVGTRLAEKMSEAQMTEFEQFIGGNTAYASQQLDTIKPGWRQSPEYQSQLQAATAKGRSEAEVIAEFAAFSWLETNFPNYKDVVAEEFEKLKGEVRPLANQILASSAAAQQAQAGGQPAQPQVAAPAPQGAPAYQQQPAPAGPAPAPTYGPAPTPNYAPQPAPYDANPAGPAPMPQQPAAPQAGDPYAVQPQPQPQAAPAPQPQYGPAAPQYAAPAPAPYDQTMPPAPAGPAPAVGQPPQYPQPVAPPPYTPQQ